MGQRGSFGRRDERLLRESLLINDDYAPGRSINVGIPAPSRSRSVRRIIVGSPTGSPAPAYVECEPKAAVPTFAKADAEFVKTTLKIVKAAMTEAIVFEAAAEAANPTAETTT